MIKQGKKPFYLKKSIPSPPFLSPHHTLPQDHHHHHPPDTNKPPPQNTNSRAEKDAPARQVPQAQPQAARQGGREEAQAQGAEGAQEHSVRAAGGVDVGVLLMVMATVMGCPPFLVLFFFFFYLFFAGFQLGCAGLHYTYTIHKLLLGWKERKKERERKKLCLYLRIVPGGIGYT